MQENNLRLQDENTDQTIQLLQMARQLGVLQQELDAAAIARQDAGKQAGGKSLYETLQANKGGWPQSSFLPYPS